MNTPINGVMVVIIFLFYFFYSFANYGIIPFWLSILLTVIFGLILKLHAQLKEMHVKEWSDSMEPDAIDIENLDSKFKNLW